MASLFRTVMAARSATAAAVRPIASTSRVGFAPLSSLRWASSSTAAAAGGVNTEAPSATPLPTGGHKLPRADHLFPPEHARADDPDRWWRASELSQGRGFPGNHYTGRSLPCRNGDYGNTYKRLMGQLTRANVRKELRLAEFYEKPTDRRRRLSSERHRKRFQEEIRRRVQLVRTLQTRK